MTPDQLTLQERVRRFNLGTPTAMHVGTHELVNDLWRELEKHTAAPDMLAALQCQEAAENCTDRYEVWGLEDRARDLRRAAIAKATGEA